MFFGGTEKIPHYHGDELRRLFVIAAVFWLVAIPIFGDLLPIGGEVEIVCALALVLLAGFTSPHAKLILILNVVGAAVAVFAFEFVAITSYQADSFMLFLIREAVAVILLFALYAGVRTLRAMMQGKIGRHPDSSEFKKKEPQRPWDR